jgi:phosphoglycolate phosphatase
MSLVIFDLDGTLIDSRLDLAESTNEMLETYGAPALAVDAVARMVGEGAKKLVERALVASGLNPDEPAALDRFRAIYDRRLLGHTKPYEGIFDVVRSAAARAPLAVLTNKPEAPTRRLLDAFDLARYFKWVIGGDSAVPRKPDPAGLLHLVHAANATTDATLLVGDSMIDVETGRRARVRTLVALYGFGHLRDELELTDAEWTAATPADVGVAIARFTGAPDLRLDGSRIKPASPLS